MQFQSIFKMLVVTCTVIVTAQSSFAQTAESAKVLNCKSMSGFVEMKFIKKNASNVSMQMRCKNAKSGFRQDLLIKIDNMAMVHSRDSAYVGSSFLYPTTDVLYRLDTKASKFKKMNSGITSESDNNYKFTSYLIQSSSLNGPISLQYDYQRPTNVSSLIAERCARDWVIACDKTYSEF